MFRRRLASCFAALCCPFANSTAAETFAVNTTPSLQVLAFPGAEGAGKFATGGRGGKVVRVTNLNAKGPGSLAEAVDGPDRIVIFDLSGTIDLAENGKGGRIAIAHPNITIAGQSAPGEGICIRGGSLQVLASNVIIRHVRVRRGFISDGDMGDALSVKPRPVGEQTVAVGRTAEEFEKIRIKKLERGKQVSEFIDLENIMIDHCSATWATDENLTVTHARQATISYCIAAEGLDYTNANQTPPNHSEGGLWGSATPDGRSTMHHVLFAHNRLRNPRTTAGGDAPPVLTLANSVVYNWSEYATHTGSERVHLQWLGNYYRPGPDTPADARHLGFQFHGHPGARVFAQGNVLDGSPAATENNRLAIGHNRKFKDVSDVDKAAMIVAEPLAEIPVTVEPAARALESVLAHAGATLPSRDTADQRIVATVRERAGRVIAKETDLPEGQRWPDLRSLPSPPDADGDGLPDFWEKQFGAVDSAGLGAGGYSNIEHYLNNTDPRDGVLPAAARPVVYVAAAVSRAYAGSAEPAQWRIWRTGDSTAALTVEYQISGDAAAGRDYAPVQTSVTIPAGEDSITVSVAPLASATDDRTVVLNLAASGGRYFLGCPSQSLIVVRRAR